MTKKKKQPYKITLYFHTNLSVYVEAENEKEAIEMAREKSTKHCYVSALLEGMQEDNAPDVEVELPF